MATNYGINPRRVGLGGKPAASRTPVMQGKISASSDRYTDTYSCSQCAITYTVVRGRHAVCPMCEQHKRISQLEDTIYKLQNELNRTMNDLESSKSQVDVVAAMRGAIDVIGPDDLVWLKAVIYRWQADRSKVAIKARHAAPKKGKKKPAADGFIAIFRAGVDTDAEEHTCTSVGGIALAAYLDEATALVGQIKALELLARAVMSTMTGSVDG